MYMKIYPSDPLAQLLSLLWYQADRQLVSLHLLEQVAHQFYMMPCSLVAKTYRLVAGSPGQIKEVS